MLRRHAPAMHAAHRRQDAGVALPALSAAPLWS
jgi:hypothetical protein